jgi:hypothetical protein
MFRSRLDTYESLADACKARAAAAGEFCGRRARPLARRQNRNWFDLGRNPTNEFYEVNMKSTLALDSLAFQAITELRRAVALNQVKAMPFIKGAHPSELRLKDALAQAHVFDFGHLLDAQHADCLSTEAAKMVNEASRDRGIEGLLLPFPRTAFLFRNLVHRTFVRGIAGFFRVLVLLEQVGGIVVHQFYRALGDVVRDDWGWAGSMQFDRDENNLGFFGFDMSYANQESERVQFVNTVWTSVGLLNTTFEGAVGVDAADPGPRKLAPRAFETLQPSIGVVHVNKPLVIRKREASQTCGRKMPGHDRRQHKRTYKKSGKTIIVPAIKVNGGANGPMVKRIKIDQPL